MKVFINGKEDQLEAPLTVAELLAVKKVRQPQYVTVELNETVIERASFDKTTVKEGDKIELVYFMGGGNGGIK